MRRVSLRVMLAFGMIISSGLAFASEESSGKSRRERPYSLLDLNIGMNDLGVTAGYDARYSRLDHSTSVLSGGRAAVTFIRAVSLGMASYNLVNRVETNAGSRHIEFGYRGLTLGMGDFAETLHERFEIFVGSATLESIDRDEQSETFKGTFLEISLGWEMNVYRWMQASFGLSHRFVSLPKSSPVSSRRLSSAAGFLSLSCGLL